MQFELLREYVVVKSRYVIVCKYLISSKHFVTRQKIMFVL